MFQKLLLGFFFCFRNTVYFSLSLHLIWFWISYLNTRKTGWSLHLVHGKQTLGVCVTNVDLLHHVCYSRRKENHQVKIRGNIIPLNLMNHFSFWTSVLILCPTWPWEIQNLRRRGFCLCYTCSVFSVAILNPNFS